MKRTNLIVSLIVVSVCFTACNLPSSASGSYYNSYTAYENDDSYEISGKAHVEDKMSILYVTASEQTSFDIYGELKSISDEVQIIYVNPVGEEIIIAEGGKQNKRTLDIDTTVELDKGEGCIIFKGNDVSFKFKLLISNLDKELYDYISVEKEVKNKSEKVEVEKIQKKIKLSGVLNEAAVTYSNNIDNCTVLSTGVDKNTIVKVLINAHIFNSDESSSLSFNSFKLAYQTEDGAVIDVLDYEEKAFAIGSYECRETFEKELELPEGNHTLVLNQGEGKNYKIAFTIKVIEIE